MFVCGDAKGEWLEEVQTLYGKQLSKKVATCGRKGKKPEEGAKDVRKKASTRETTYLWKVQEEKERQEGIWGHARAQLSDAAATDAKNPYKAT